MDDNLNETSVTKRNKKNKKRKWPWVLLIILLFFVGVFAYGYYQLNEISDNIYTDISKETHRSGEIEEANLKEPLSILLMGIDTEDQEGVEKERSNSMKVMTINPANNKTTMVSIPRDTRTELIGEGIDDKISHAYTFGGPAMSVNTVENLLDIPIDYFVSVNMNVIQQVVDTEGEVSVTPKLSFNQDGYSFVEGQTTNLNGEAALAYSQRLDQDPEGSVDRQERQRQVLLGTLGEDVSFGSILNYQSILKSTENDLQTNLKFKDMMKITLMIFKDYNSSSSNINQIQMNGEGTRLNDNYYLNVSEDTISEISTVLKNELELSE